MLPLYIAVCRLARGNARNGILLCRSKPQVFAFISNAISNAAYLHGMRHTSMRSPTQSSRLAMIAMPALPLAVSVIAWP